ncbi:hypothetical protein CAF53_19475 [Sphingobium sp. LB126]|uniref:MFS transporter n=1 Tax=Sphingobium sp. LB126 TaxID=1983755 RepID=UPI000C204CFB|nr:MFS transporter [Sphingobium sp. LB126]PJG46367.1 hypothetical protein CAF53_19475 [Sphingobium sp. LB126]
MLDAFDHRTTLTGNQRRLVFAATMITALECFDYYVIAFVIAFVVIPWKLTFGETALILTSSGIGTSLGAFSWGYLADRIGRRPVLVMTVLVFALATGALAFTPERGWVYLAAFRFLIGVSVGGLYAVLMPLVQEFMPAHRRGQMAGLVTSFVSIGIIAGAVLGAFLTPLIGWRGLFALGALLAVLAFAFLTWIKESPFWLCSRGRWEEARASIAWALECSPADAPDLHYRPIEAKARFLELFRHPRALAASWLSQLSYQIAANGVLLWAPTLLALQLAIPAASAAKLMISVSVTGLVGRLFFSAVVERFGRRPLGLIVGIGAATALLIGACAHSATVGGVSLLWVSLILWALVGDGGYAIVGPYSAEVWPSRLRATGMGSAYGFGAMGKIIGPLALALITGSANVISPEATLDAIVPGFGFYAACYFVCGLAFLIGFETKGLSFADIDARASHDRNPIVSHHPAPPQRFVPTLRREK